MLDFLINPKIIRCVTLLKGSCVYQLPYIIPVIVQLVLWTYQFAAVQTMTRGLFYIVYQILQVVVALQILMIFGKNGVWAWLGTMAFANFITLLETIAKFGVARTVQEWIELMTTFGEVTGDSMRAMEIHNTVFAYGPFIIVQILWFTKIPKSALMLFISQFFFLLGLKRIAVAGVILALIVQLSVEKFKEKTQARFMTAINIIVIVGTLVYIYLISQGLFDLLEKLGLDTKGRDLLYQFVNRQYEFQPFFFGRGLGFSSLEWEQTGRWQQQIKQDAFHNDFLKMFVEIGFIPYVIWIYAHIKYRTQKYFKYNSKVGLTFFATMIYMIINYLTDNTFYYFYVTGSTQIVVLWAMLQSESREELQLKDLKIQ